ncbi:MAG: leucine-rich repeat domain-containing protein, partial [Cellvibrionaceae bacterium]|nr:leucine-rich repeat domain-containing protein [Cellvibrionaceae bacterium]
MITNILRFTTVFISILFCNAASALPQVSSDKALQACIEKTAQKNNWTTLEQVTSLKCHKKKIYRVDGIKKLSHLKKLSLFNNKIEEADFTGLAKLEELNIARNQL